MRRALLVMAAAALMAVLLVASGMPAFAKINDTPAGSVGGVCNAAGCGGGRFLVGGDGSVTISGGGCSPQVCGQPGGDGDSLSINSMGGFAEQGDSGGLGFSRGGRCSSGNPCVGKGSTGGP